MSNPYRDALVAKVREAQALLDEADKSFHDTILPEAVTALEAFVAKLPTAPLSDGSLLALIRQHSAVEVCFVAGIHGRTSDGNARVVVTLWQNDANGCSSGIVGSGQTFEDAAKDAITHAHARLQTK